MNYSLSVSIRHTDDGTPCRRINSSEGIWDLSFKYPIYASGGDALQSYAGAKCSRDHELVFVIKDKHGPREITDPRIYFEDLSGNI